jgi:hypothetical protein
MDAVCEENEFEAARFFAVFFFGSTPSPFSYHGNVPFFFLCCRGGRGDNYEKRRKNLGISRERCACKQVLCQHTAFLLEAVLYGMCFFRPTV